MPQTRPVPVPSGPGDSGHGPDSDADTDSPSSAAYVTITTTPDGPRLTAAVPALETRSLLDTVTSVSGVSASALGPYLMARAMRTTGVSMPWQFTACCLLLAALTPLLFLTTRARRPDRFRPTPRPHP